MVDHPPYPHAGDEAGGPSPETRPVGGGWSRSKVLVVIIGVVLVAVMLGLHLAGVAPH